MKFLARMACIALCLCTAGELCALTLQYGKLFSVSAVRQQNGLPVLPLSRGKYANIRVLEKETFELLKTCGQKCTQPSGEGVVKMAEIRPAKTRKEMWIADVSFDGKWLITFLVFARDNGYDIKLPEHFEFLDSALQGRVEDLIETEIKNLSSQPRQEKTP